MISRIEEFFRKHAHLQWLVPAVLCLLMALQMAFSVRQMSQEADESTHLYAGMRALACGDYAFGREHPPLAKMVAAAGAGLANDASNCVVKADSQEEADQAVQWMYARTGWWPMLLRARAAVSLFALGLLVAVWWVGFRLFGPVEAALAALLVAFEPNLLAHGPLVLNDVAITLFLLLTIFAFHQWAAAPSPLRLLAAGLCLGLALLSKHSAGVLVVMLPLLAVMEAMLAPANRPRRLLRNLGGVAAMAVLAALIIWMGYGMRYSQAERRASDSLSAQDLAQMKSPDVLVMRGFRAAHLLPQAYLDGLVEVHGLVNSFHMRTVVLGEHMRYAPWYFFPLVLVVKLTLGSLAIFAIGFYGLRGLWVEHAGTERMRSLLFFLVPALLYLAASLMIRRISGIRHLLPILPLLFLVASVGVLGVARRRRWVEIVLGLALLAHLGSSLACYPNYLSYANEAWGGPGNLYHILPLTDEGQGYVQVAEYMKQHPGVPCWVNGDSWMPPSAYVPSCGEFGTLYNNNTPAVMQGIVFISGTRILLDGKRHMGLEAFGNVKPKAKLGGSAMLVYEGTFDTHLMAALTYALRSGLALKHDDNEAALANAQQALEIAPDSPTAQLSYGVMLARMGRYQEAMPHCQAGYEYAVPIGEEWTILQTSNCMHLLHDKYGVALPQGLELPPFRAK